MSAADNLDRVRSAIPGIVWPALPDDAGAMALDMQFQLEQSQWCAAADLQSHQFTQLQRVLEHAFEQMPFWRARLTAAGYRRGMQMNAAILSSLPVLTRAQLQERGEQLVCTTIPPERLPANKAQTSGSTGRPITCFGDAVTQFMWRTFTLRDHLWHRRDFGAKLAVIRSGAKNLVTAGWGIAVDCAFSAGPLTTLSNLEPIDTQLEWLQRENPRYLLGMASNLRALAELAVQRQVLLPNLREVRSFGEALPSDLRKLCRAAWDVPLTDVYSAQETGYIALQCPDHEHYHVQAENVIVEILDENRDASAPGQAGRVVITTLNNLVMPLIRYEIGDYAVPGSPCACGRGLPVIERIMGRHRNMMLLPDGSRRWPSYPAERWAHVAPVKQLQMVQKRRDLILVRVVMERALSDSERVELTGVLRDCLGYPFELQIERVATIARADNQKFEDFICEL